MANVWKQPSIIANEALRYLQDALVISNLCAKDKTSDFSQKSNGYAVGQTISFKQRPEYSVDEFSSTISAQPIAESVKTMTIEKHYDVSVALSAVELAMDLDDASEQVIKPAAYALASQCDVYVGTKILDAAGMYASTSLFTTAADMALARKAATIQQLEMDRFCLTNLSLEATLLGKDWVNTSNSRGDSNTINRGYIGYLMGMDFFSSANFPTDLETTVGNGSSTTNNTGSTNLVGSSTLTFDSLTGQIEPGDRLAIAGVKRPVIASAQAVASSTSVALTQQINEIIPDGAAITTVGSGATSLDTQGVIMDTQTLAVAFPVLDLPNTSDAAVASDGGVSVRVVSDYNISNKTTTMSMDVLVGAICLDPRRATALALQV